MVLQEDPPPMSAAVSSGSSRSPGATPPHRSNSKGAPSTAATASNSAAAAAAAWITRDTAERLLADRAALAAASRATGPAPLVAASAFEVTAALDRLQRDRAPAVRAAFDRAAEAILTALQRRRGAGTTGPAEDDPDPAELPQVLRDWEELEALRHSSFERTHGNKDSLKRSTSTGAASAGSRSVKIAETVSMDGSAATDSVMPETVPSQPPSHVASTTSSTITGPEGPKFTRNTPASSAAALDHRFTSSRAILCAAGNLHFDALTPAFEGDDAMDILNIPQNPSRGGHGDEAKTDDGEADASGAVASTAQVNLGAVRVEATTLGRRSVSVAENAVRRSKLRYEYRKENALFDRSEDDRELLPVVNPFSWRDEPGMVTDDESTDELVIPYRPKEGSLTKPWTEKCLPRLLAVMERGAGHAVYHDVNFASRHGRLADLLKHLSQSKGDYGPHLIITVEPELSEFAREFYGMTEYLGLVNTLSNPKMRVLTYQGSPRTRRKFRQYFSQAKGLPESPFHVVATSYADFLSDYLHFCQVPWDVVILDDGLSWMSAAQGDHNSAIGTIWDGIWSTNDQHVGLAGTSPSEWNFECDVVPEASVKEAWIGLTARHRIMTSATTILEQRQSVDIAPVSGLISFLAPHFAATVREEWDRSRITADSKSMDHFRGLVARSTIVHSANDTSDDMHALALLALTGKLNAPERQSSPIPEVIFDDSFVSAGKISFGRRSSLLWLGPSDRSWLRYELGRSELQHILDSMKISNKHGAFCEEITTASSTTSSGANGQVTGSHAFRLAVCCGRHFGSEQGLRQHINGVHAPPGTWLCRTCGVDCMTSQARTHHERSCGQPQSGAQTGEPGASVGATPTVGQGSSNKTGVGKKKSNRGSPASAAIKEEKDPDGSLRVPGYRGVWVNKKGKHFLKLDGRTVTAEGSGRILWFDDSNEAAKKYDELVKTRSDGSTTELNFNADGSRRSFYDDMNPASTSGLGGSAVSVVPALSIINIKDLPPHVKPLLRDPRQTSRTGGNSKRHVYAYRGVCRQARKGHDRWQSQISFMGVNHYLGTFDSEWDAAAIYAWAHLILYGEEATKQAQKEGEEAAAAYEQEQRDIAAGKIPEPQAKPKKPKKLPTTKADSIDAGSVRAAKSEKANIKVKVADASPKKRKGTNKETTTTEKKTKTHTKACKLEKEAIGSTVAKGVTKALVLAPRFDDVSDSELIDDVSGKLVAAKRHLHTMAVDRGASSTSFESLRPCIPLSLSKASSVTASAMLVGLSPTSFDWDLQNFISSYQEIADVDSITAIQYLAVEYDEYGANEKFCSILQGSLAILGQASDTTQEAYSALGLGAIPLGGAVGKIDCHVGGVSGSCSEMAACVSFSRNETDSTSGTFMLSCLADDDIVTLNGKRISKATGLVPLVHEDVISVGARVMVALLSTGV